MKAVPDPVLEPASGLLHELQWMLLASQHHRPSRGLQPRLAAVRSARPTGLIQRGRLPDSQIAWAKTRVTPGRRTIRAGQRSRW